MRYACTVRRTQPHRFFQPQPKSGVQLGLSNSSNSIPFAPWEIATMRHEINETNEDSRMINIMSGVCCHWWTEDAAWESSKCQQRCRLVFQGLLKSFLHQFLPYGKQLVVQFHMQADYYLIPRLYYWKKT
jgi:hypothetical protein